MLLNKINATSAYNFEHLRFTTYCLLLLYPAIFLLNQFFSIMLSIVFAIIMELIFLNKLKLLKRRKTIFFHFCPILNLVDKAKDRTCSLKKLILMKRVTTLLKLIFNSIPQTILLSTCSIKKLIFLKLKLVSS